MPALPLGLRALRGEQLSGESEAVPGLAWGSKPAGLRLKRCSLDMSCAALSVTPGATPGLVGPGEGTLLLQAETASWKAPQPSSDSAERRISRVACMSCCMLAISCKGTEQGVWLKWWAYYKHTGRWQCTRALCVACQSGCQQQPAVQGLCLHTWQHTCMARRRGKWGSDLSSKVRTSWCSCSLLPCSAHSWDSQRASAALCFCTAPSWQRPCPVPCPAAAVAGRLAWGGAADMGLRPWQAVCGLRAGGWGPFTSPF